MLSVIQNGRTYEIPLEIEAKGDAAVEAWLVSAEAQEERGTSKRKRVSPGQEG
jgi:hypothetical protein